MTLALTSYTEPITVLTFAGNYWNLRTMSDDQIKWLASKFDETDPINKARYLDPIKAELARRQPSPEKLKIIEALKSNTATLLKEFGGALAQDGLLYSDLNTGKDRTASTRYGEGLELALAGRWELPKEYGSAFKVDSYLKEFGGLKYEVKSKAFPLHNFNHCQCDDFLYKAAGKLRGYCKHVCCAWFVIKALRF